MALLEGDDAVDDGVCLDDGVRLATLLAATEPLQHLDSKDISLDIFRSGQKLSDYQAFIINWLEIGLGGHGEDLEFHCCCCGGGGGGGGGGWARQQRDVISGKRAILRG